VPAFRRFDIVASSLNPPDPIAIPRQTSHSLRDRGVSYHDADDVVEIHLLTGGQVADKTTIMSLPSHHGNTIPAGRSQDSPGTPNIDDTPPRYAHEDPQHPTTPWPRLAALSPYRPEGLGVIDHYPVRGNNDSDIPGSAFTYSSTRRQTNETAVGAGSRSGDVVGFFRRVTGQRSDTTVQRDESDHDEGQTGTSGGPSAANAGSYGTDQAGRGLLPASNSGWYTTLGSIFSTGSTAGQHGQEIGSPFNFRHEAGMVGSSGEIMLSDINIPTAHENASRGEGLDAIGHAQKDGRTAIRSEATAQIDSITTVQGEFSIQKKSNNDIQIQNIADTPPTDGNVGTQASSIQYNTSDILMDIRPQSHSNNHTLLQVTVPNVVSPVHSGDLEAGVPEHAAAGGISTISTPHNASEADGRAPTRLQRVGRRICGFVWIVVCFTGGWFEACCLTIGQEACSCDDTAATTMGTWYRAAADFVKTNIGDFFCVLSALAQVSFAVAVGSAIVMVMTDHRDTDTLITFLVSLSIAIVLMVLLKLATKHPKISGRMNNLCKDLNHATGFERCLFVGLLSAIEASVLSMATTSGILMVTTEAGEHYNDWFKIIWIGVLLLTLMLSVSKLISVLTRWRTRRTGNGHGASQNGNDFGCGGVDSIELEIQHNHGNHSNPSVSSHNNNTSQISLTYPPAVAHGPLGPTHASQASPNDTPVQHPRISRIGIARSDSLIGRYGRGSLRSTLTSLGNNSIESFGAEEPVLATALTVPSRRVQLVSSPSVQAQSCSSSSTITLQVLPHTALENDTTGISVSRPVYDTSKPSTPSESDFGSSDAYSGFTFGFGGSGSGYGDFDTAAASAAAVSSPPSSAAAGSPDGGGGSASLFSRARSDSDDTIGSLLSAYQHPLWATDARAARPGNAVLQPHAALRSHPVVVHLAGKHAEPQSAVFCNASAGERAAHGARRE
jgi:hypothetical protein